MKKVLVIGPFPEPTTGVSLANEIVLKILREDPNYYVSKLNTSFHKFDESIGKFSWDKFFFNLKFNLSVFKTLSFDVVYLTPGQTFLGVAKYLFLFIIPWIFGKEVIFHVHGNHLRNEFDSLRGIKRKLFHFILSRSSKAIALSESLLANVQPFVPEHKSFFLYNFAQDHQVFKNKLIEIDKRGLRIVYLSNLMKEKGINDLLDALFDLENQGINYSAKIAGNIDAENEEVVRQKLSRLKNTEYIGIVKGDQKVELLEWANVFILPTYYQMEGQPISILEAMAAQCVIVTTSHAGIPDVVKQDINGFFVEKENAKSIVSGLKMILATPSKFNEIAIRNRFEFEKKYTINAFGKRLKQILSA